MSSTSVSSVASRIEGYQVMVDGKEKMVCDLTPDEAKMEICQLIDHLEQFDILSSSLSQQISAWRRGAKASEAGC